MKNSSIDLIVRGCLLVSLVLLTVGLLANMPLSPGRMTGSSLRNRVAAFSPSQNTITGNFSSDHEVSFEVFGWPEQTQVEIKVWYYMTVVQTYKIRVQVFDSEGSKIADELLTIKSTSIWQQNEYANTTVDVKSPENYAIRFLPTGSRSINFRITQSIFDNSPPTISDVDYEPGGPTPDDEVTVSASITDDLSGVKETVLWYSTDGGDNWNQVQMTAVTGSTYTADIPKQEGGINVQFKVSAEDIAGFSAESSIVSYTVKTLIFGIDPMMLYGLAAGIIVIAGAIFFLRRRRAPKPYMPTPPTAPPTLVKRCPSCNAEIPTGAEFCPSCGRKLE